MRRIMVNVEGILSTCVLKGANYFILYLRMKPIAMNQENIIMPINYSLKGSLLPKIVYYLLG